MKICTNCGHKVKDDDKFCMSCGVAINHESKIDYRDNHSKTNLNEIKSEKGEMISTLTVIFGAMGFWPLPIVGSIIGIILYIISKNYEGNEYVKRARLGYALSVGSLLLYIAGFIMLLVVIVAA
jgi:uncharacterized membrane protein YvbJ